MKRKLIITFILVVLASVAILSLTGNAGSYKVNLDVDKKTAEPGETITVEVSISDCAKITAAAISFEYDEDVLELTSGEILISSAFIKDFTPDELLQGMVAWISATDVNDTPICKAVFTVKKHAQSTDIKCNFQVSYEDASQDKVANTFSVVTCKHSDSEYEKLDATNHNKVCSGCGLKEKEGHKWDSGSVTTKPDHFNPGEKTFTCTACGQTKTEPVDQIAHTFNQKNTDEKYLKSEATCTSPAIYYYSCSCGEKGTATFNQGSALNHHCEAYTYDNNATCTSDGTESGPCIRCGEKQTRTKAGSKLGHSFTKYVFNNDATCTKDGTETSKCDRCTAKDTRKKTGSMTEHTWSTKWSSGKSGHYHKCTECGEKDEVIPHVPGAEATETTPQKCTVCNYTIKSALGHITHTADTSKWITDGEKHWHACTGCDDVRLDEAAHTGGTATCKNQAVCDICKVAYGELGEHTYDGDSDLECNVCGEKRTCSHTFGDWTTTKEPTYDEPGEKERVCTKCAEKETAAIDKLEPTAPPATDAPTQAPTQPPTQAPEDAPTQAPEKKEEGGCGSSAVIAHVAMIFAVCVVLRKKNRR